MCLVKNALFLSFGIYLVIVMQPHANIYWQLFQHEPAMVSCRIDSWYIRFTLTVDRRLIIVCILLEEWKWMEYWVTGGHRSSPIRHLAVKSHPYFHLNKSVCFVEIARRVGRWESHQAHHTLTVEGLANFQWQSSRSLNISSLFFFEPRRIVIRGG